MGVKPLMGGEAVKNLSDGGGPRHKKGGGGSGNLQWARGVSSKSKRVGGAVGIEKKLPSPLPIFLNGTALNDYIHGYMFTLLLRLVLFQY